MKTLEDLSRKGRSLLPGLLANMARGSGFEAFEIPIAGATRVRAIEEIRELNRDAKRLEDRGFAFRREAIPNRALGAQTVPVAMVVRSLRDLGHLVQDRHLHRFPALSRAALRRLPGLESFWRENPVDAWSLRGRWSPLARALEWFRGNPSSGLLPRAIPWGLHGKFVEENEPALRRLLPLVLPAKTIPPASGRDDSFESLAGLRRREPVWRVRILDPALLPDLPARDLSMRLQDWRRLLPRPSRLVVVENLESFLSLSQRTGTVAVWGSGFAVLRIASWLADAGTALYWGDLDAQGFEILDALRRGAPKVRSIGMDPSTLAAHPHLSSGGTKAIPKELERLDRTEWAAYRKVVEGNIRLEQEKLPMPLVEGALDREFADEEGMDDT